MTLRLPTPAGPATCPEGCPLADSPHCHVTARHAGDEIGIDCPCGAYFGQLAEAAWADLQVEGMSMTCCDCGAVLVPSLDAEVWHSDVVVKHVPMAVQTHACPCGRRQSTLDQALVAKARRRGDAFPAQRCTCGRVIMLERGLIDEVDVTAGLVQ